MRPRTILVLCRRWRMKLRRSSAFDFYEEVSADMVSAHANIISTRWVVSKITNDNGTWRSKARFVARG
jgi:hypothetical protein